jgi:phytol kinase
VTKLKNGASLPKHVSLPGDIGLCQGNCGRLRDGRHTRLVGVGSVAQDHSRGDGKLVSLWPYFTTVHWTWQLNVAVPTVYSIQLTVKGLLVQDPNDPDVKTMSRSGRPIELCQGPLLFTLVMIYCGLYQFRTDLGVYIMAALGYGDGIAPLIGKRFPYIYYPTWGPRQVKTISGSIAMCMATIVGVFVLQAGILGDVDTTITFTRTLAVALAATVAEGIAGKWDNPVIALAVIACYKMWL